MNRRRGNAGCPEEAFLVGIKKRICEGLKFTGGSTETSSWPLPLQTTASRIPEEVQFASGARCPMCN
ncbi:hypothetical protein IG631_03162 [Alternaria alternata]|nr:hypothetical protein IG631_03162 [Alternaria alternata]